MEEPIASKVPSLKEKVPKAVDPLRERERGLFEVDSLRGEVKLLSLGSLDEVAEAFPSLGEWGVEVKGVLDNTGD